MNNIEEIIATYGLNITYILLVIALALAIVFPLIQGISNPKILVKPLIGIAVIAVVFFAAYASVQGISPELLPLAEAFPTLEKPDAEVQAAVTTRGVDASLMVAYVLSGLCIVGILYTEVAKFIR